MTRDRFGSAELLAEGLRACETCMREWNGSHSATRLMSSDYFEMVPLLFVRVLQFHAYSSALGDTQILADVRKRLRLVVQNLSFIVARCDPQASRPPSTIAAMEAALKSYSLCGRSGRVRPFGFKSKSGHGWESSPSNHRATNRSKSFHVHLHLTFHGGTNFLGKSTVTSAA